MKLGGIWWRGDMMGTYLVKIWWRGDLVFDVLSGVSGGRGILHGAQETGVAGSRRREMDGI